MMTLVLVSGIIGAAIAYARRRRMALRRRAPIQSVVIYPSSARTPRG